MTSAIYPAHGHRRFKAPVATVLDLPTSGNQSGDCRAVLATSKLYLWNGAAWISGSGGATQLDDLSDVSVSTPVDANVLIYDTTEFKNKAISGDITINKNGVAAIGSKVIVDADVSDTAAIGWSKISKLGSSVDDLGDVAISPAAALGQNLTWNGTAWANLNIAQTFTVGPTGCNYTTLTAAFTAITDAAANKWYRLLVSPGTFTEDITVKPYILVEGSTYLSSGTVLNGKVRFTGTGGTYQLQNMTVTHTPTATDDSALIFNDATGTVTLLQIGFMSSTGFDYAVKYVDINASAQCFMQNFGIMISNSTASTNNITLLKIASSTATRCAQGYLYMSSNAASGVITAVQDESAGDAFLTLHQVDVRCTNAAFAGTVRAKASTVIASGYREASEWFILMRGAGTGTVNVFNTASSGGTYLVRNSNINVSNFATIYRANVGTSDRFAMENVISNVLLGDTGAGAVLCSPYDERDSGIVNWVGSGDYWSVTSTTFTLLRGGCGRVRGNPVFWSGSQNVSLVSGSTIYVYINALGVIGATTTVNAALYTDNIVLFQVWYDGTVYRVFAEDHPFRFDSSVSYAWHATFGPLINGDGAVITRVATGTGGAAGDRQVKIVGAATLEDHGLTTTISDSAGAAVTFNVVYTNGSGKWIHYGDYTELPRYYNNAGTPTALAGGRVNYRLYVAKDNKNSSACTYYAVMGSVKHANSNAAALEITNNTVAACTAELLLIEPAQLGFATVFDSGGGYIETLNVKKQQVATLFNLITSGGAGSAATVTTDTTNFNKVLSAADTTVQAALETLDEAIGTGVDNRLARYDGVNKMQSSGCTLDDFDNLTVPGRTILGADIGRSTPHLFYGGIVTKTVSGKKVQLIAQQDNTGTWNTMQAVNSIGNMTLRTSAADNTWNSVCWSPELGLFCAVASSGTSRVMTSPDGITWTSRTAAAANSWNSVCWSPELGLFVAVSNGGEATNQGMTSPNGITWTGRTILANYGFTSVCWSPELGLFVAVGDAADTTHAIRTSTDGITWNAVTTTNSEACTSVCWSPELGLFAAAISGDSTHKVLTSPDGITWTRQVTPNRTLNSICWAPEIGLFAGTTSSLDTHIVTSSDGITWTDRAKGNNATQYGICWAPELRMFLAIGYISQNVSYSRDGITWTTGAYLPSALQYTSICWSPELKMFVAVSKSGTGTRVTTCHSFGKVHFDKDGGARIGPPVKSATNGVLHRVFTGDQGATMAYEQGTITFGNDQASYAEPTIGGMSTDTTGAGLAFVARSHDSITTGDMVFQTADQSSGNAHSTTTNKAFSFKNATKELLAIYRNGDMNLGDSSVYTSVLTGYGRLYVRSNTGTATQGVIDGYRQSSTTTDYLCALNSDVGGSNTNVWRVEADGDTISATASYTSDERAKKDIAPIEYGLAEILQLQPKSFRWYYDADTEVKSYCASTAQHMETVMPELVRDDGLEMDDLEAELVSTKVGTERIQDGVYYVEVGKTTQLTNPELPESEDNPMIEVPVIEEQPRFIEQDVFEMRPPKFKLKSVYEKELIAVLVKAVQEQNAIIEALKSRIEVLENV